MNKENVQDQMTKANVVERPIQTVTQDEIVATKDTKLRKATDKS